MTHEKATAFTFETTEQDQSKRSLPNVQMCVSLSKVTLKDHRRLILVVSTPLNIVSELRLWFPMYGKHGGFHKWVTPIAGWFIMENPSYKWMIWGYPYFRKPPHAPKQPPESQRPNDGAITVSSANSSLNFFASFEVPGFGFLKIPSETHHHCGFDQRWTVFGFSMLNRCVDSCWWSSGHFLDTPMIKIRA